MKTNTKNTQSTPYIPSFLKNKSSSTSSKKSLFISKSPQIMSVNINNNTEFPQLQTKQSKKIETKKEEIRLANITNTPTNTPTNIINTNKQLNNTNSITVNKKTYSIISNNNNKIEVLTQEQLLEKELEEINKQKVSEEIYHQINTLLIDRWNKYNDNFIELYGEDEFYKVHKYSNYYNISETDDEDYVNKNSSPYNDLENDYDYNDNNI